MSCEEEAVQNLPTRNWELVWSDEFEGNAGTLPDASKWTYDTEQVRMVGETKN